MRLLIALVVWIAAVAGAVELSTAVAHSIHTTSASASSGSAGPAGPTGSSGQSGGAAPATPFDPSSVKPTDARSMFRAANLGRALAAARTHLGADARLTEVALYPGYAVLTAVKNGSETDVDIQADGNYSSDSTGGSSGGSPLFSLAQVKASAPAALARRIAGPGHVPESQLNYMVAQADPIDHQFRWLVYPKQGNRVEYFEASGPKGQLLELLNNSSSGPQPVRG